MTKQNPDVLCNECRKFDSQFENGCNRLDVLVVCNHDEDENCKACEKDKFMKENPMAMINLRAEKHTCRKKE